MLNAGILKPVEKATPWIDSFVLVEGKNLDGSIKLRICLDPTNLNKAVICEPYCSKTPEDIAHLLANAKVIIVTGCSKGFWHEELGEDSSYLTTFNTEFGCFRFTRMLFWVYVAGDVFQQKLDKIFGKLTQVMCIADDIMVVGYKDDHSNHDLALTKLFQTAHKNNVKLNFKKLQYKKHEVTFFGENYSTQGRKPDPKKIKAIVKMKQPENKKEMQTFLGMVWYLQKFPPHLSVLAEPLRDLIKTNLPYILGPEHTIAMNAIQEEMVWAPILKYFDPRKKTVLQTDASCKGLGACLLQDGHPIYFANKSLTDAEKGYVAIELKALAVSWACEKFHHFLYGSHFTQQTDQKPLESILAWSLNEATPRLQRLLIKASAYDFNVKYIPGPTNQVADCLSWLGCIKDNIVLPKLRVNAITQQLSNPDDVIHDIRLETAKDDELSLLKHIVTTEQPEWIREVPKEV